MWMPGDEKRDRENKRRIIGDNIDKDTVGRKLTPEARERAIDFAVDNWPHNMGNGDAAKLGIKHVTSGVLKQE